MNSFKMYVCSHIHQLTSLYIDKMAEISGEVDSNNGFMNISVDENTLNNTAKANVKSEGVFPEGWNGSAIDDG